MNEEWESSEWDNEIEEEDSSDYYNEDSREWTESWDKEEDSSDWDESDSSSQIEIIDLIQSRDYDSVEIIRAVIPIKGTYKNDRYPFDNNGLSLDNNRPFINRGPPNHNPPISLNPHPVNHNPHNQPPPLNPPTTSSLFHGEDITFLNVRLKENKYKPSFFKDLILKEYTTCSICLCNFTNYSKVLSLLCTHYFHSKCIIPWIKKHKQCPCCREGT